MDTRIYQTRIEALAQRWQAARTPEDMRELLHELAHWFQESHNLSVGIIDDYKKLVDGLTAALTHQTATVNRLTVAVENLTAQRQALAQTAAEAYEAGFNEYVTYTNDFLEAHHDAWEAYLLRGGESLVVDPAALNAVDPRHPDTALRLCHACHKALD
mgnify:CR=1 FL=1